MLSKRDKIRSYGDIITILQNKNLKQLLGRSRAVARFNFPQTLDEKLNINYLIYPPTSQRIIRSLVKPGTFFGLATHTYYTLELGKKQKLTNRRPYLSKLQVKKDSRFFYGLVLS